MSERALDFAGFVRLELSDLTKSLPRLVFVRICR
jgi:hypothetical protein